MDLVEADNEPRFVEGLVVYECERTQKTKRFYYLHNDTLLS